MEADLPVGASPCPKHGGQPGGLGPKDRLFTLSVSTLFRPNHNTRRSTSNSRLLAAKNKAQTNKNSWNMRPSIREPLGTHWQIHSHSSIFPR